MTTQSFPLDDDFKRELAEKVAEIRGRFHQRIRDGAEEGFSYRGAAYFLLCLADLFYFLELNDQHVQTLLDQMLAQRLQSAEKGLALEAADVATSDRLVGLLHIALQLRRFERDPGTP